MPTLDPVWVVVIAYFARLLVGSFGERAARLSNDVADGLRSTTSAAIETLITAPLGLILAGWFDMALWNLIAPAFGLPTVDLLTAIAAGMLLLSLFQGIGVKPVRLMEPTVKQWPRQRRA